jgi:hypothetical protein
MLIAQSATKEYFVVGVHTRLAIKRTREHPATNVLNASHSGSKLGFSSCSCYY